MARGFSSHPGRPDKPETGKDSLAPKEKLETQSTSNAASQQTSQSGGSRQAARSHGTTQTLTGKPQSHVSPAEPLAPHTQAAFDQLASSFNDDKDVAPEPETPKTPEAPAKEAATSSAPKPKATQSPSAAPSLPKTDTKAASSSAQKATAAAGGLGALSASLRNFGSRSLGFASHNRGKLIAGGGISAVLISIIMGFFMLLPWKLALVVKSIEKHETQRLDEYASRRVQAILFRYLYQSITNTEAADGFYKANTIIKTVYGNLRINQFREKLLTEKGMKFEAGSTPGSIKLTLTTTGEISNFNSADQLIDYMNTDIKGRQAREAIKLIVNDTYKPLHFLRRRHMRKYMMNAYNIRKWSIKKQEDTKDPAKPDAPSSTISDIQSRTLDPSEELTVESVDCAMGTTPCPDPEVRSNPDGTSELRPPTAGETSSNAAAESTATDTTKTGIRDGYKAMKEAAQNTIESALTKLVGPTITKAIFKAVPIVGWLALAADLDKFFWDGTLVKIGIMLHSAQYAAVAGTWSSLADQAKEGQLTASQVNIITAVMDGIEQSNAVQRTFFDNNSTSGVALADDKRVGSDQIATLDPSTNCDPFWSISAIGKNPPPGGAFWTYLYRMGMSSPPGPHTTLCVLHGALNTLAGFVNFFLGGLLNAAFNAAIAVIDANASALLGTTVHVMDLAQAAIGWIADQVWTPVATGRETGATLGNAIDAGWDVTANQMCRDALGCKNISTPVAFEQQAQIAAQDRTSLNQQGVIASLFSLNNPQTMASQMIAKMPSTPNSMVASLSSVVTNPFHFFAGTFLSLTSPAHAATPTREPNGVQQTGYDETELADPNLHVAVQDIAGPPGPDGKLTKPDGKVDQYDCPQIADANTPNQCLIDTAAAQILCASTDDNDDGGLGGNGDPGPCGETATPTAYDPGDSSDPVAAASPKPAFGFNFGLLRWSQP